MDDEKIKSKSMRSSTAPRPGGRCPKGSNAEGSSAKLQKMRSSNCPTLQVLTGETKWGGSDEIGGGRTKSGGGETNCSTRG